MPTLVDEPLTSPTVVNTTPTAMIDAPVMSITFVDFFILCIPPKLLSDYLSFDPLE